MNGTHKEFRKICNVGFDPDEVRWCVSAVIDGKEEWFESASETDARFVAASIACVGYEPKIQQLPRGEIIRQFGELDTVYYARENSAQSLFTVVEHDDDLEIFTGKK